MNIAVVFMLLSSLASVALVVYAISGHTSERSLFLILTSLCGFFYAVGYLFEITAPTLEAAFVGVRVQKMGSLLMVPLNYLFIRDIYGEPRLGTQKLCLLLALPVFNLFAAQAYPLVRLHYTDIAYFHNGLVANCQGFPGPVNYLAIAQNMTLVLLSLGRILRHLFTDVKVLRRQNLCLLVAILFPLLINLYHTLTYDHLRVDLNPFAVSFATALLLYSVRIQNLLGVVPLARAQVIETMTDAFVVCSNNYKLLDANQAARGLFPELHTLGLGEPMEQMRQLEGLEELSLQVGGELRFFTITRTPILQNNRPRAICIVFHDITDKENQLQQLYGRATFDPLMHIYNRATFFDLASFALGGEKAKSRHYALLMIDIDHFKAVNDSYGHSCGDLVLETVAVLIKGHFRQNDLVGRYGGEEIVVLLENIPMDKLMTQVEKLRLGIQNTRIPFQEQVLGITVSIGVSFSPGGTPHSLEEMLSQADSALYKAKNSGRNCVRMYGR